MKTKKLILVSLASFAAVIIMSSCHSNVPCPVYAQAETLTENITID
jgi:hypothetical protein